MGNALSVPGEQVKLIAMADLFPDRLDGSYKQLKDQFGPRLDVPPERRFLGFDAYRKAIDCLRPGDVALLTTHAAFRPTHLEYAVEKGLNVFMEKTVRPRPGRREAGHRRRAGGRGEEPQGRRRADVPALRRPPGDDRKIRDGEMGEIELIRAFRMGPAIAMESVEAGGQRAPLADPPALLLPLGSPRACSSR